MFTLFGLTPSQLADAFSEVATTVEDIVKVYNAVKGGVQPTIDAVNNIETVISQGGKVTPDQWDAAITTIRADQAALNASIDTAEGIDPKDDPETKPVDDSGGGA